MESVISSTINKSETPNVFRLGRFFAVRVKIGHNVIFALNSSNHTLLFRTGFELAAVRERSTGSAMCKTRNLA